MMYIIQLFLSGRQGELFCKTFRFVVLINTSEVYWLKYFCCDHSKGSPASAKKKGKMARKWDNAGTLQEGKSLDYSGSNGNQANENDDDEEDLENLVRNCLRNFLTVIY